MNPIPSRIRRWLCPHRSTTEAAIHERGDRWEGWRVIELRCTNCGATLYRDKEAA